MTLSLCIVLLQVYVDDLSIRVHFLYPFLKLFDMGSGKKWTILIISQGKLGNSQGILIPILGGNPEYICF